MNVTAPLIESVFSYMHKVIFWSMFIDNIFLMFLSIQGLLTTTSSHGNYATTSQETYTPMTLPAAPCKEGERQKQERKKLREMVMAELQEEMDALAQEKPVLVSTMHDDFTGNGQIIALK